MFRNTLFLQSPIRNSFSETSVSLVFIQRTKLPASEKKMMAFRGKTSLQMLRKPFPTSTIAGYTASLPADVYSGVLCKTWQRRRGGPAQARVFQSAILNIGGKQRHCRRFSMLAESFCGSRRISERESTTESGGSLSSFSLCGKGVFEGKLVYCVSYRELGETLFYEVKLYNWLL